MKELAYRFKAYQIQKDGELLWQISYPDFENIVPIAKTLQEALDLGNELINSYQQERVKQGKAEIVASSEPSQTYDGKLVLRFSKSNQDRIMQLAKQGNVNVSDFINTIIQQGIMSYFNDLGMDVEVVNRQRKTTVLS